MKVIGTVIAASALLAGCGSAGTAVGPTTTSVVEPPAQEVTVERVIDGDTFVLTNGECVRVLGIDSCEMATPVGADAKAAAEGLLNNQTVMLHKEPGVDRDRFDRLLRNVELGSGRDFGGVMVVGTHTGVYAGRNDANDDQLEWLRRLDADNGRECGEPEPIPANGNGEGTTPWPLERDNVTQSPTPTVIEPDNAGVYYKNCDAAEQAGAAPLSMGEPGYRSPLDGDSDGVACE